jgi:hypothetical protein
MKNVKYFKLFDQIFKETDPNKFESDFISIYYYNKSKVPYFQIGFYDCDEEYRAIGFFIDVGDIEKNHIVDEIFKREFEILNLIANYKSKCIKAHNENIAKLDKAMGGRDIFL